MPDNVLASQSIQADFLVPVKASSLEDFEWGGVALNNPLQGMRVVVWRCFYSNGFICVKRTDSPTIYQIIEADGVSALGLAFDLNMNVAICYVENGLTKLYWYDTAIAGMTTTVFAEALNPCISLDDTRERQSSASDIIFAYQKTGGGLYYRQQRDRYLVERQLASSTLGDLRQIGMNKGNRFQYSTISY